VGEVEILSSMLGPVEVGTYLHSLGLPTHHILLLNITGQYRLCAQPGPTHPPHPSAQYHRSISSLFGRLLGAHVTILHKDKKEAYNIMTESCSSLDRFMVLINRLTLSYPSEINGVLWPQRVSLLLKKCCNMTSKGYPYHPVRCNATARCRLKWQFGAFLH
jgi:hypothetical protein